MHEVGLADGTQIKVSEDAGVYIAAHIAERMKGNVDEEGNPIKSEAIADDPMSFMNKDFDDRKFRGEFGMNGASKANNNDNFFPLAEQSFANSDHDHYGKDVKRKNLIKLFLEGNEIDKYITTHMYGEI